MTKRSAVAWNSMISAYAKNGRIIEARCLFDRMPFENRVSRRTMITGYSHNGCVNEASQLFERMPKRDKSPACCNAMIPGHAKNRGFEGAVSWLNEMPMRDLVLWNSVLVGCTQDHEMRPGLKFFDGKPERDAVPWNLMVDGFVWIDDLDPAWVTMLNGYSRNGRMAEARRLFDQMPERNLVSWSAMISGYVQSLQVEEAHKIFMEIPDRSSVSSATMINGYVRAGKLEEARDQVLQNFKYNFQISGASQNPCHLCPPYNQCQRSSPRVPHSSFPSLATASCFDPITQLPNPVQPHVLLSTDMEETIASSLVTPLKIMEDKLSSYLKHVAIDSRAVHGLSLKIGCLCSTFLCNNLLHAYNTRSMVGDARKLFDEIPHPNAVTWSAMISGYTQMGNLKNAIILFREMQHEDKEDNSFQPNKFTFGSILTGCARAKDVRTGAQIHCSAMKFGVESDAFIAGTLVDMYAKCGKVEESWSVFDQTPNKDVVSWTAMLTCVVNRGQHRLHDAAFGLFKQMICRGVWPVVMTFASLVKIFDEPNKLKQAKQAHGCMVKLGIKVDYLLGSALIAMYGRCGGIDEAMRISVRMNNDVVSWTSLLVAYMQNGYNMEAINVFRMMIGERVMIDPFVIASIIVACSASEDLGMGKEIHGYIVRNNFTSDASVGNALITFYGRYREIRKAEMLFQAMRDRDVISWTAMLTCYGQNGCGQEVLILFRQMLQEGLIPPIFSITGAIRACSTIASLSTGKQMHSMTVKFGIDEDLSVENSLITMYAKCGSIEVASRVFNSMAERDLVSWNALITGFSQHGLEKEALEMFDHMQKEGIQPDDFTFTGLLVSCSRVGLVTVGCEYFRSMNVVYGLEPTMEHYACMVDLFGRAGKLHEAVDFINAMPCDPDFLIWEALLASCEVHGNVELGEFAAKKILQMRPEAPSPCFTLSNILA